MSLYPSTTVVPSTSLFPEVGEQIACFDDYTVTLEATYDSVLDLAAYGSELTAPDYSTSGEMNAYASTLDATAYSSSLEVNAYSTSLEADLLLEVVC